MFSRDVLVDDLRADRVRSVLGGVGDRVVHALDAAFPDQVDDQLQLVQALVVGDLGLVARLDERLEAERISCVTPPQSTVCSPNRSVSVSSANDVSTIPARAAPSAAP